MPPPVPGKMHISDILSRDPCPLYSPLYDMPRNISILRAKANKDNKLNSPKRNKTNSSPNKSKENKPADKDIKANYSK